MINLFTSYFKTDDLVRQGEVDECLIKNKGNNLIGTIYLLLDQDIPLTDLPVQLDGKVRPIYLRARPTYNVIFELIRQNSSNDDTNIISNSDIYFDETISHSISYGANDILALCRWECSTGQFLNRRDSQDVWIMQGHPRQVQGDFPLGRPGCDNAISDRFAKAGYNVISPSKSIRTWHLHSTQARTYNVNHKVPEPYKFMDKYT